VLVKTFEAMMAGMADSLSDLASSNDRDDGEEENEETKWGKLSEDEESG
jgi:hypothetical protein